MKSILSITVGVFVGLIFGLTTVVAQETAPRIVEGGILNGKAISLPKPEYPEVAKKADLEGTVVIAITIDEEGNVVLAKAAGEPIKTKRQDGEQYETAAADPILREAAEQAAMKAKFTPTRLSGNPVRVHGVITYRFVADVLNGKAVNLPKPEYPDAAKAVNAHGTVNVQVVIDEGGNVVDARAVSGHPLLRLAAEQAARQATFSQTFLSGQPVKVSGILTYNFVP